MTIKTYRAATAGEALVQVKHDLGCQAVILHTRTFLTGGFLGFRRRRMTEITATADESGRSIRRRGPTIRTRPQTRAARPPHAAQSSPRQQECDPVGCARATTATETAPPPTATSAEIASMTSDTPMKEVARMIVSATERPAIEEEMVAIKRMVGQVLRTTRGQGAATMPDALFECYLKLMEAEVSDEIADAIIGKVRDDLDVAELGDPEIVRQAVLRRLAAYIDVCPDSDRLGRASDSRPTTVALIGPTGVGKTTTLAKLAATHKLRHGRRVGLITCDTYRIAAVDQLRTYANIIGVELKVVLTPREMAAACDALANCDVILIDTAGRAPRDEQRLKELRAFLEAAQPHQTHLVLSSNSGCASLDQAIELFGPLGCQRVIFTKLDESVNFGVLVNVASRIDASLSFVTTGQEVPDHIEVGNADRLARLVLDGEPVR